jgi:hypothetical protein
MTERWLPVDGHLGYEVSDLGRVRSIERTVTQSRPWSQCDWTYKGKTLKLSELASGYLSARLGMKQRALVHRLVAAAFLTPDAGRQFVNHKDGNKQNNAVGNLEWCTKSENGVHGYQVLGRKPARQTPVVMGGVHFPNMLSAGRAHGVTAGAVRQALLKGNRCQGKEVLHG